MEMTVKGTLVYHRGGKCNGEARISYRVRTSEGEDSFRFHCEETDDWELHSSGREIVETAVDFTFTPLDELSKSFPEASPETAASMKPIKGEFST